MVDCLVLMLNVPISSSLSFDASVTMISTAYAQEEWNVFVLLEFMLILMLWEFSLGFQLIMLRLY